ncbi:hypothetical protein GGF37_005061 [Kickxella alabastrina]|nr:hypothetical protein GGF37_005061 [Kickxella alabastrina]
MRRFLFEPENKVMNHQLWADKKFVRRANWDAAPEFMHPKAIELLKEGNGQLKRPAEDEINAGRYYLAIVIGAALGTYQEGADNEVAFDIQMPEMVNSLAHLILHSANFKLQDTVSELVLDMAMR